MMTEIETAPVMTLRPQDVDNLVDELQAYHAIYSPLFPRREQRQWSADSLRGLRLDIPRQSIEPMVLALYGADGNAIRAMQQFASEGAWSDAVILTRHGAEVEVTLGDEEGVLTLDGSDLLKQGKASVGVKRQYCGEVGKRANGQAGVFLGYASQVGSTLLDRRLYLPIAWVEDDDCAERRATCGVPSDIRFQTKPELGWEMMREVVDGQQLRARWVACDEAFGRDTALLDDVASSGLWYVAEVPHDTRVWTERPLTAVPPWSGRGRKPSRERLCEGQSAAEEVAELAARMVPSQWQRRVIKEGSQGPMVADFWALRVVAVGRRVNTLCKGENGLLDQLAVFQTYHNFVLPHASLRQPLLVPELTNSTGSAKIRRPCTPAMAAGLTDHVWSLREVLLFRVPPWPQPQTG